MQQDPQRHTAGQACLRWRRCSGWLLCCTTSDRDGDSAPHVEEEGQLLKAPHLCHCLVRRALRWRYLGSFYFFGTGGISSAGKCHASLGAMHSSEQRRCDGETAMLGSLPPPILG